MNRRTFFAGCAAAATVPFAGCALGGGEEDEENGGDDDPTVDESGNGDDDSDAASNERVDVSRVAIDVTNNDTTSREVDVLVESTREHVHWSTYDVGAGASERIDVDVPSEDQFVAVQVRLDDEVYSEDFTNWTELADSCGGLTLLIGEDDASTGLYYDTSDENACAPSNGDDE